MENMYLDVQGVLRILTPLKGYKICTKEKTQVFDDKVYLGKNDVAENYISVTEDEAEQINAELENESLEELQQTLKSEIDEDED